MGCIPSKQVVSEGDAATKETKETGAVTKETKKEIGKSKKFKFFRTPKNPSAEEVPSPAPSPSPAPWTEGRDKLVIEKEGDKVSDGDDKSTNRDDKSDKDVDEKREQK